jgi:hypothetical protein
VGREKHVRACSPRVAKCAHQFFSHAMTDERPNIILIITDQQRFDTIRAL